MAAAMNAPPRLANGTGDSGPSVTAAPNVMARMAPSAEPAETPSVNGVARGLRNSACKTTPAEASAAPTTAPANIRGKRATKKIWASTLSVKGMDLSNTLDRLMDTLPTSGASRHVANASAP